MFCYDTVKVEKELAVQTSIYATSQAAYTKLINNIEEGIASISKPNI